MWARSGETEPDLGSVGTMNMVGRLELRTGNSVTVAVWKQGSATNLKHRTAEILLCARRVRVKVRVWRHKFPPARATVLKEHRFADI